MSPIRVPGFKFQLQSRFRPPANVHPGSTWVTTTHMGDLGFGLAKSWLLWALEESTSRWEFSVSLLFK